MERIEIDEYFALVHSLLGLFTLKSDLQQKVLENYGNHKADAFLKQIAQLNEKIGDDRRELLELEQRWHHQYKTVDKEEKIEKNS